MRMRRCKYLSSTGKKSSSGNEIFICKLTGIRYASSSPKICNNCEDFTPADRKDNGKRNLDENSTNYNEETVKLFPFEEFRPSQKDVIIKTHSNLSGGKNIILSAPTGFGKSAVNITLCRHYKSYYVVATKNLQDQIEENFGGYVSLLKGRSNYMCSITKRTCADCIKLLGVCPYNGGRLHCDDCDDPCPCKDCAYERAKRKAEHAQIVVTNMSMLMTARFLKKRDLIIVDEAHELEDTIRSNLSITFRRDQFKFPLLDDFRSYIPFLQEYRDELKDRREDLLEEAKGHLSNKITASRLRDMNMIENSIGKIDFILNDYDRSKEEWGIKKFKKTDGINKIDMLSFFPITAKRFLNVILGKGDRFVLSSATPPFKEELGPFGDNVEVIEVSSAFPVKNRPIYLDYVGYMSLSNRAKTIPKMAEKIKELATERTVVHCHSYGIANDIAKYLDYDCILQRQGKREEDLGQFKDGGCKIFLSVNMENGISLDDELCRVNILAKVPYPNLKDPQIQKRRELEGDRFMNIMVARKITQAYGRATRSENDWSHFYILDSNFKSFFRRNRELFPRWLKEAMVEDAS
ncbi:MAG: DEAD/DEAH box helicase [Candidatus Methanolliviera hydrocarbonicum]|uniref:DEAD/DEAH box helicase n=1 Tax=Candidatus Methanolliviera hydrocarbonicum TaxID=2491085 RepID=A0A520KUX4_9EURY|nr:MAG: DEAD/DEAH box helicase [Candidatus Methanolliviera hydrocarbonicum]